MFIHLLARQTRNEKFRKFIKLLQKSKLVMPVILSNIENNEVARNRHQHIRSKPSAIYYYYFANQLHQSR